MFIDATYEGDLMAAAGVSYHVGREANSVYHETLNGVQPKLNVKLHRFTKAVDPFVKPGDPSSGLLWGIQVNSLPPDGTGDKCVQAYCYRLCTTDVPENRRPWPKPADYDESRYELLLRNFDAGDRNRAMEPDLHAQSQDRHEQQPRVLDRLHRRQLRLPRSRLRNTREESTPITAPINKGFCGRSPIIERVPQKIRDEFQRLALAKDEFVENDNWPTQLYVREARRMIGPYVMTEHNCRGSKVADDSVGMGAYGMDSHNCQRYVTPEGYVQNEGDVQVHGFEPYPISYRSIIPKQRRMHQPARARVPVQLAHRVRLDPHGAGVHDPGPVGRHRRVTGDRSKHHRAGSRLQTAWSKTASRQTSARARGSDQAMKNNRRSQTKQRNSVGGMLSGSGP